jgi:hypothetical protein
MRAGPVSRSAMRAMASAASLPLAGGRDSLTRQPMREAS